jgi:nucleoid-associated protein YgaU
MALKLFKLEKMEIEAYSSVDRKSPALATLALMFNPASFQESHAIAYESARRRTINSPAAPASYTYTPPVALSLTLILDGTGVNYAVKAEHLLDVVRGKASVAKQVANFKTHCWRMNGNVHQPNFLVIRWGRFAFNCRLAKLDISYTLFDTSGDPLRAELAVQFVKDDSAKTIVREAGNSSPDLTHVRTVKSGDTLPLLCSDIYGSPSHYLRVARDNGLDDFRRLVPGQRLRFAPLTGDPA